MTIKKGDRLTLTAGGVDRPVEALSDLAHGHVVVRDERGCIFSASVQDVKAATAAGRPDAGRS